MNVTLGEAIQRVAERTYDNTKSIQQQKRQRRHQVIDMYGVEYTRQGDANAPATFYISISPDMVYLERFEFKLIIQPFTSTVSGGTSPATVTVNDTSLSVSSSRVVSPNPHRHSTQAHTHNIVTGISQVQTTARDFRVYIEGIDVTAYLMAQYGSWIDGQGVYPTIEIGKDYDILEVACDLMAEGRKEDADKLTCSGYKEIRITSGSPFQVTLVNYLKLSHLNR